MYAVPLIRSPRPKREPRGRAARFGSGLAALLALLLPACVRQDVYDEAIRETERARAEVRAEAAKREELAKKSETSLEAAEAELERLRGELRDREVRLAEGAAALDAMDKKADDFAALNAEMSERLRKAGHNVELLVAQRSDLSKALEETRARLEELRRHEAAAEARLAQLRELGARFQKLADEGVLTVVARGDRMMVELPSDSLFEPGRTALKPEGRRRLAEVAAVLRTLGAPAGRRFQVAAHTDDAEAPGGRPASSWELSIARAAVVTRQLVASGMAPETLSAAGYGAFSPLVPNDGASARAKNRRVEIVLVPSEDELVKVPTPPPPAPPPEPSPKS